MVGHDENYHDDSGLLSILMGLIVVVGMSALPGTIGWVRLLAG